MSDATLREIAPFMVDGVMIAEVTAQNGTGDLFMCQRWAGLSPATAAEYVNWLQRALCIADLSALQRRVEEMEGAPGALREIAERLIVRSLAQDHLDATALRMIAGEIEKAMKS